MNLFRTSLVTIVCLILVSFRQDSHSFSFSMTPPENWHEIRNDDLINNLRQYKLSEEELRQYLASHSGSTLLLGYTKYKQSEHAGLIPTIQVNLRRNNPSSFKSFFQTMSKSAHDMGNYLKDYEFIDKPDSVLVGGKKAVYFCVKFSMPGQTQTIKARSKTYAVASGDIFFQINFTDGEEEDCSKLYDEIIKTVKFE